MRRCPGIGEVVHLWFTVDASQTELPNNDKQPFYPADLNGSNPLKNHVGTPETALQPEPPVVFNHASGIFTRFTKKEAYNV
ncbi:MAG: hypothetical protein GXO90_10315 [FCB group bacterium]|nr:hypothetical protein [FCB group bacterium]